MLRGQEGYFPVIQMEECWLEIKKREEEVKINKLK